VKSIVPLVRHSLGRSRGLLVLMAVVVGGVQALFVLAAVTMQESGRFSSMAALLPPFMRQAFGDSLFAFMSFHGLVAFGYFHPMIVAGLGGVMIALGTEPAAEAESRFLDLVLARPIERSVVVARSVVMVVLTSALLVGAMLSVTFVSLHALAGAEAAAAASRRLYVSLALNLWALLLCIGAASLAAASVSRRRSVPASAVGLAMLALFLVDYLSRVWDPAASIAPFSPFHYFNAMSLVMGAALPLAHIGILAGAAAFLCALAFVLFARRDL
jgi:ABC-type transport system involved in multi-copper enzyme maturation permease subunit